MFLTGDQKIVKKEYPKAYHKKDSDGIHIVRVGTYLLGYSYESEKHAWANAADYVMEGLLENDE